MSYSDLFISEAGEIPNFGYTPTLDKTKTNFNMPAAKRKAPVRTRRYVRRRPSRGVSTFKYARRHYPATDYGYKFIQRDDQSYA